MDPVPFACDLSQVGIDPDQIDTITLLHRRREHRLFRIGYNGQSFVLKWYAEITHPVEPRAYELLRRLQVPTLLVHGWTEHLLLLEDLNVSLEWRLATEADICRPEIGIAVANWYQTLHTAGRTVLADGRTTPDWLSREADGLNPATIEQTGKRIDLMDAPGWCLAVDRIGELQRALCALPSTLVYGDFHWTNLALSRGEPHRAVVFDYHLLGIGPRVSDYRNVCGSLDPPALLAFQTAFGQVDRREAALDAPLATLHALQFAAGRTRLPRWADSLIHDVQGGTFESQLKQALALL